MKLASVSGNWKLHPNIKVVAFEETDCCYSSDKITVTTVTVYRSRCNRLQMQEIKVTTDYALKIRARRVIRFNRIYSNLCKTQKRIQYEVW